MRAICIIFFFSAILFHGCVPNKDVVVQRDDTYILNTVHGGEISISSGEEEDWIIIRRNGNELLTVFLGEDSTEFSYLRKSDTEEINIIDRNVDGIPDRKVIKSFESGKTRLLTGETIWKSQNQ